MEGKPFSLKSSRGFTLLEAALATSILAIMLTMLYGAAWAMMKTARTQDSVVMLNSEARQAMTSIVRNLRQSQATSLLTNNGGFVALGNAPVTNVQFMRVADVDGNGSAVNLNFDVETTGPFWITRDTNDANGDGQTLTQLVRIDQNGQVVEVMANHISPVVVTGDMYSAPNGGVLFQNIGGGNIQVTLILRHRADANLPMMVVRLDEVVSPRN